MYSDEEIERNQNEDEDNYSSGNEKNKGKSKKKEELDITEMIDIFHDILEEYSYEEPMLSSVGFSDICFQSNYLYNNNKNSEKYFNKSTIFELSGHLYDIIQKMLYKYDDVDRLFLDINQNKIYSRIVNSFNKYYILN